MKERRIVCICMILILLAFAGQAYSNLTSHTESLLDALLLVLDSDYDGVISDEDWTVNSIDAGSGRAELLAEDPSSTNPSMVPDNADTDSGIGQAAADQPNIIAGGVESVRHSESSGDVTRTIFSDDNTHGGYNNKVYSASITVTASSTLTIDLNIPSGERILQCQLHVQTALAGGDTWDSELNDGSQEEAISTASAVAINTNVNHWADADTWGTLTDAETDIVITKNGGGSFTAQGVIEAHCMALSFDTWDSDS